jgi:hypothetical protein
MTLLFEVMERKVYLGSVMAARDIALLQQCRIQMLVDCRGDIRGYMPPG